MDKAIPFTGTVDIGTQSVTPPKNVFLVIDTKKNIPFEVVLDGVRYRTTHRSGTLIADPSVITHEFRTPKDARLWISDDRTTIWLD